MRPWQWDDEGSHVRAEVGWVVLEPTKLAVLDHGLVKRMVPWPQLGLELFNRGTRRAHHLAVALAIAHHQRVEDRLLLTLWHLAERWGRVHPDGIVVPLPLGHQRLADLVGAQRQSVTTAMGGLTRDGAVSRRWNAGRPTFSPLRGSEIVPVITTVLPASGASAATSGGRSSSLTSRSTPNSRSRSSSARVVSRLRCECRLAATFGPMSSTCCSSSSLASAIASSEP